ncbi:family 78 glycoside hydrolase catalytic domain [Cohnella sp. GCM10027633]|uniref:family 78 glycoside hydrolase catalytic domain n=1 Tax=unclassified Cohnella TaxID=2636738 RepID=UPI00363276D0
MLTIEALRCEYMRNPIGIGVRNPRISWKLKSEERGVLQSAYRIEVAGDPSFASALWDSGEVSSSRSVHVELSGLRTESFRRYYYRVKVWDANGRSTDWSSETAFWEMGVLEPAQWQAQWIVAPAGEDADAERVPMLRRSFAVKGDVREARIYATALGLYELELNGRRVGDGYFAPGWTSYKHRLQVQAYDATDLLRTGDNAIGAYLGKGWFSGNLAWNDHKNLYGNRQALFAELHVRYADGTVEVIATDDRWRVTGSPMLLSEIYHGETYDARLEQPGWSEPGFDDQAWLPVETISYPLETLVAQENEPVRKTQEIAPVALIRTPSGETVIDFGQNMVGWVRFSVEGEAGRVVELHHAEVLDRDGNFYTDNLRAAKQTIRYTLKGTGAPETYEPRFTFQGFRYIRLTGFGPEIDLSRFAGVVLHSDMEATGSFECSDPLVNQLQRNIEWGLRGNFLDVPTDCPQRDERLGWTGDAQMFIRTAAYLRGVAPFFAKWSRDLAADQREDGGVPFVVPHVLDGGSYSSAAWGDAAVIVPWTIYLTYGDTRILEEQYDSMTAWVSYIRAQGDNEYLWNTGFHFGDWLGLDSQPDSYIGATDRAYIATAFYAYSVSLVQKTAAVLGKDDDARKYAELYANILKAFTAEFVTSTGRLAAPTQTGFVLGLMFGLLEGVAKERAIAKLIELLEDSKHHLTTGFVGTPYLNHVLSDNGHNGAAYKLLLQQDYPSWLYPVTKGATTIWEHWDGIKPDGSFWSKDMNSFNHYAYGAIGDWLYRSVAGIDTDEASPGYKHMIVRPRPEEGLTWAEARLTTMYGEVRSYWNKGTGEQMEQQATIPPNATATVVLPGAKLDRVTESGEPLSLAAGIASAAEDEHGVVLKVGSGNYSFQW